MRRFLIFALTMLFVFSSAYTNPVKYKTHEVTVPLRFDYYYTYEMVVDALKKLHKAFPHLTKLEVVGKSEEGRAIYCMTLNNPKTGKELDKPGIWVDANIHGNEIQAGEVALYLLDYLLHRYGVNDEITKLVDKKCFYVVPVVNPDGRYHFFADGNTSNDNRGLRRPHDDDRDGLLDEDFPDDLDGDGNILMGFGNLALVGALQPENFIHIVLDNQAYGTTGNQPTISAQISLEEIARAAGYRSSCCVYSDVDLLKRFSESLTQPGPHFIQVKVSRQVTQSCPRIPYSAQQMKERFRGCLSF